MAYYNVTAEQAIFFLQKQKKRRRERKPPPTLAETNRDWTCRTKLESAHAAHRGHAAAHGRFVLFGYLRDRRADGKTGGRDGERVHERGLRHLERVHDAGFLEIRELIEVRVVTVPTLLLLAARFLVLELAHDALVVLPAVPQNGADGRLARGHKDLVSGAAKRVVVASFAHLELGV